MLEWLIKYVYNGYRVTLCEQQTTTTTTNERTIAGDILERNFFHAIISMIIELT